MKTLFVAFLFTLLVGCSTLGTSVTRDNNQVKMPHYSFTAPADQGWYMQRANDNFESVILNKKVGQIVFQVALMRNVVYGPSINTPANVVAEDFMGLEERIMIERGVKRGQFQLKNLVKRERTLGDKTFYTMTYEVINTTGIQFASLYLLFPKPAGNNWFIVAHYSESIPPSTQPIESCKADFESLLQGLVLR